MNDELKHFGVTRYTPFGIGKKIGDNVWIHHSYINDLYAQKIIPKTISQQLLFQQQYINVDVVRINIKNWSCVALECLDFNTANEPQILRSTEGTTGTIREYKENRLIYHSKWLFVTDNYELFNVREAKERTLAWKRVAPRSREFSSKIGRHDFWQRWLISQNLPL